MSKKLFLLKVLIYGGAMVFLGAFWGGVAGFVIGDRALFFASLGATSGAILMAIIMMVRPEDFQ